MRFFVVLTFLKRGIFTVVKILPTAFSHVHTDQPPIHVYIFYEPAKMAEICLDRKTPPTICDPVSGADVFYLLRSRPPWRKRRPP